MDYAIHIIVEKVAINSQEVIKRDPITRYALQCPTSIGELGLCHTELIDLLKKVQNILLAEQPLMLAPGMPGCPTCGNTLKKNGDKIPIFMPSLAIIPSASKNITAVSPIVVGTVRPPSHRPLERIFIRT